MTTPEPESEQVDLETWKEILSSGSGAHSDWTNHAHGFRSLITYSSISQHGPKELKSERFLTPLITLAETGHMKSTRRLSLNIASPAPIEPMPNSHGGILYLDDYELPFLGLLHVPSFSWSLPDSTLGPVDLTQFAHHNHSEIGEVLYIFGGLTVAPELAMKQMGLPRGTDPSQVLIHFPCDMPPYMNKDILVSPVFAQNRGLYLFNPIRSTVYDCALDWCNAEEPMLYCEMKGTQISEYQLFYCGGYRISIDSTRFDKGLGRWIVEKSIHLNKAGFILDVRKLSFTKVAILLKLDVSYEGWLGASLISGNYDEAKDLGDSFPVSGTSSFAGLAETLQNLDLLNRNTALSRPAASDKKQPEPKQPVPKRPEPKHPDKKEAEPVARPYSPVAAARMHERAHHAYTRKGPRLKLSTEKEKEEKSHKMPLVLAKSSRFFHRSKPRASFSASSTAPLKGYLSSSHHSSSSHSSHPSQTNTSPSVTTLSQKTSSVAGLASASGQSPGQNVSAQTNVSALTNVSAQTNASGQTSVSAQTNVSISAVGSPPLSAVSSSVAVATPVRVSTPVVSTPSGTAGTSSSASSTPGPATNVSRASTKLVRYHVRAESSSSDKVAEEKVEISEDKLSDTNDPVDTETVSSYSGESLQQEEPPAKDFLHSQDDHPKPDPRPTPILSVCVYVFGGFVLTEKNGRQCFRATNDILKLELIVRDHAKRQFHSEALVNLVTPLSSVAPRPRGFFAHVIVPLEAPQESCSIAGPQPFQAGPGPRLSPPRPDLDERPSTPGKIIGGDLFFDDKLFVVHGGVDEDFNVFGDAFYFSFSRLAWRPLDTFCFDHYERPKQPYEDEDIDALQFDQQVDDAKLVEAELRCCHHRAIVYLEGDKEYMAFLGGFTNDFLRHYDKQPYTSDKFDVLRLLRILILCTNSNLLRIPVLNVRSQVWKFKRYFYDLSEIATPEVAKLFSESYMHGSRMCISGGGFQIVGKQLTMCHGIVKFVPGKAVDFGRFSRQLNAPTILLGGHIHFTFPGM